MRPATRWMVEDDSTKGLRIALIVVRAVALALLLLLTAFAAVGVAFYAEKFCYDCLDASITAIALSTVSLCVCLASTTIQAVLLAYTAQPTRRALHRGCCCATAVPYTTDMAWDIVMCVYWGLSLALALIPRQSSTVGSAILFTLLTALFIAAAALSSVMRHRLRLASSAAEAPVTVSAVAKDVV